MDSCLGISCLYEDSFDVLYQRPDGTYYWKNIKGGFGIEYVSPEGQCLDNDTNETAVRAEDGTPTKAFLNDRA